MSASAGSGQLNLETTADAVKNLRQCLTAYEEALASYVGSLKEGDQKRFAMPPVKKLISDNFDGEKLQEGRKLVDVLGAVELRDLDYTVEFQGSAAQLNPPARALEKAVEAVRKIAMVEAGMAASHTRLVREEHADSNSVPFRSERPHSRSATRRTASPKRVVSPPSSSAPLASPAPAATASFTPGTSPSASPSTPTGMVTFKDKMRTFFAALVGENVTTTRGFGSEWTVTPAAPAASGHETHTLTNTQATHPDIKVEVLDDSTMKFTPEKAKTGAGSGDAAAPTLPNTDYFTDYFRLIFISLEASGQKYELQSSVADLINGLQSQYGLKDKAEIEAGLKKAITEVGGKPKLASFLAGSTLTNFEAFAVAAPASTVPVVPASAASSVRPRMMGSAPLSTAAITSTEDSTAVHSSSATVLGPSAVSNPALAAVGAEEEPVDFDFSLT
jgi:hypothetical protein